MFDCARFLMVSPRHFDVSYSINPWMQPDAWQIDPQAMQQKAHAASLALSQALTLAGADVVFESGLSGQPDMVFPANAAIILDGTALMARFRHPERQGEEAPFLEMFRRLQERGLLRNIISLPVDCYQEGAGDCIWDANRGLFWAGFGPRSTYEACEAIEDAFSKPVIPLELATARCYHLDVCFCPLSGGEILYLPSAFTPEALDRIHNLVAADMLIEASEEDLLHFNINAVCVEREVITTLCTPALRKRLHTRGYHVREVDLAPFMLSGGGAYCMTLRLDRSSQTTQSQSSIAPSVRA
jgi:N-dimethylarginine dimethylaminohydrolase